MTPVKEMSARMGLFFAILLSALAVTLLASCSPKVIEHTKVEYVVKENIKRDTTVIRDSIYLREQVKGDTVRIIEYRDRWRYDYKYVNRTDTLYIRDSVAVERVKEVKVEKPLSACQKVKLWAFWGLLAAVAFAYRKQLWALIKKALPLIRKLIK